MATSGAFDGCDDEELIRFFGVVTLERARDYHRAGRVSDIEVDDSDRRTAFVHGRVRGSRPSAYAVRATVTEDSTGVWIGTQCTCPVVRMCKHGAALLLAARETHESAAGRHEWERRLSLVLDELDDSAEASVGAKRPLALQVELTPAAGHHFKWEARPEGERGSLRLRPLVRGARDNWVRSGVAWSDVGRNEHRLDIDPAQSAVLAELLTAYRAANRMAYYGSESHLLLDTFGPSLWPLLAEVQAAGVQLIPAGELDAVAVSATPVTLTLDVNGADTQRAHVAVGVEHEGEWYSADRLEVLGSAGHGVTLWTPSDRSDDRWQVVLAPLVKPAGIQTRRLIATGTDLPVPGGDVQTLVTDYLPAIQRHLPVVSSDDSVRLPEPAEPRLAMTVTWKAVDEVHAAWSWRYRVGDDDRIYGLDETRGLHGIRRPDLEAELLAGLELDDEQRHRLTGTARAGHSLIPEQTFRSLAAIAFVEDTLVPLEESGQVEIEEVGARPDYHELTEAPVIRFESRSAIEQRPGSTGEPVETRTDWLDLEVAVTIGDRSIGLVQLIEAMTNGQERIILRDGAHLRIDRPEFAHLTELVRAARELVERPGNTLAVNRHDLGLWAELAEIGLVDAQASQWVRSAQALRDVTGLPEADPAGIDAELRHYQLEGFRWLVLLWQLGLGGILADDMGLGKTMQALALLAHARSTGSAPFLVVAPTSVVSTWAHEAATFTPDLVVRTVTESRARRGASLAEAYDGADLVVTSYTLYRLEVDDYVALDWGALILDEAQMVKNHLGKTHQAVRRLEAPFRLAMTGTPMENRLMELWSLLSIVAPGLYAYPQRFAEQVANPVEKEGDAEVLERFRQRIRPFLLRRTKELVATDLPPKQEQVLEVQLTPQHRRIYDTHLQRERQNVLGLLGDFDRQRIAIFRSLTRLRQLSLDAALVDPEYDGVGSAKLDVLVEHLQEITAEGHRALVFSQFTSYLTRVRRRLDLEGLSCKYLDGRTRRRHEVVGGFKRGEGSVFLISLKAGGVGLTLTEADYVFVLDPWWNPAVEAQAVDRAHRIGQGKPVIVYRLVSSGTIEEKVMELKARKAALFAKVVDGGGGTGTPISADDVRALFAD